MTGWQVNDGYLVTIQPVGTDDARRDALARWGALPKYLDTEIANLREGIRQGYTAPKLAVRIVIDQVRALASTPLKDSPFDSPAIRDKTPEFKKQFDALVAGQIIPAAKRYADFLEKEYLPAAREAIPVTANPNGAACYDASVLYHSSSPKTAKEVHELGVRQNERLVAEMKEIGERSFGTTDVPALLARLRTDPKYRFKSREEKIAYSQAALARAKAAVPSVFGLLPKADVVIKPYPAFREKNAPNEYNPPAEDGSRPAVFFISAYQAEKQSRVEDESTAFHETIPGHHLQGAIALERKEIHPIGRYIFNSGYVEGWALYAERLADELKLFSSDVDRLGMLSSQALRASRLVVDSGLHTLGWSRQQAIDYMLAAHGGRRARRDVRSGPLHHLARAGDRVHDRDARNPRGARRGRARPGVEVRPQGVSRSRAGGRWCTADVPAGENPRLVGRCAMTRRIAAVSGVICMAVARCPFADAARPRTGAHARARALGLLRRPRSRPRCA